MTVVNWQSRLKLLCELKSKTSRRGEYTFPPIDSVIGLHENGNSSSAFWVDFIPDFIKHLWRLIATYAEFDPRRVDHNCYELDQSRQLALFSFSGGMCIPEALWEPVTEAHWTLLSCPEEGVLEVRDGFRQLPDHFWLLEGTTAQWTKAIVLEELGVF